MSENLSSAPQPEAESLPEGEPGLPTFRLISPKDLRFTEPTESEAAMGVEDPNYLVYIPGANAVVTKAEASQYRPLNIDKSTG